ncbi:MAG TPA: DUF5672 family protein [Pseudolabrys sp.]|nr:DUF5672 family protein [Pseudolabrys sp.]
MITLDDVTLCAADSAMIALTTRAMHLSMQGCKFADAVLFSDQEAEGNFRVVKIDKLDRVGYQAIRLKPPKIETPFALWIEWDGYVVEPRAWHPAFFEYDYIGAKWQNGNVGNSGFSLQSRKLTEALADEQFLAMPHNVDELICNVYRPTLEREFGIRFAPPHVADLFAYWVTLPRQPTFGFHGLSNMWRYCSDDEVIKIVEQVAPYVLHGPQFVILIWTYATQCKFAIVERLFGMMRKLYSQADALAAFRRGLKQPHSDELFAFCEKLCAGQ